MNNQKYSPLNRDDRFFFKQGTHFWAYKMFGAHLVEDAGQAGVRFTVWAPHAEKISVVGDFNQWDAGAHELIEEEESGIWTLFVPGLTAGIVYKYRIVSKNGAELLKADPFAVYSELRPKSASIVYELDGYPWKDQEWMALQQEKNDYSSPILIYEMHLGSWMRGEGNRVLSYREVAEQAVAYVHQMGYTHIELMPIVEHPFDGSWGYQATGYYSATSRYGEPKDFMYFVDQAHQAGLGVILDWVPGHFCTDGHGLQFFDGSPVFEYADRMRRDNESWGTFNFDVGKPEVQSFLISNACFWLREFHIDGLRVDAVANLLRLDQGRSPDSWVPNSYGGRENLEGVAFIKKLNTVVYHECPNVTMMAEDSTDWPLVTSPVDRNGLGFGYKWNMGWMNDVLRYMKVDPIHRQWHHDLLTFSLMYAFSDNYVLPFSHDEVVHGKCSLLNRMPGDYWQKFANLRLLYGYMMGHPGKKLLFMGGEFGQFIEWKYDDSLDWHLLDYPLHRGMHRFVKDLNWFYREHSSLWSADQSWDGFQWIDADNRDQSVLVFCRTGSRPNHDQLVFLCNFTPTFYERFRVGVPTAGIYKELLNSDSTEYGGSGQVNEGALAAEDTVWQGMDYSVELRLPPLAVVCLQCIKDEKEGLICETD